MQGPGTLSHMLPWGTCPGQACNSSLWWYFSGAAQAFTHCPGHRPLGLHSVPVHSALDLQSPFTQTSLQRPAIGKTRKQSQMCGKELHPGKGGCHPLTDPAFCVLMTADVYAGTHYALIPGAPGQAVSLPEFLPCPQSCCVVSPPFRGPPDIHVIQESSCGGCCFVLLWC